MRRPLRLLLLLSVVAGCNISLSSGGDEALGSQRIERFLERDLPQGEDPAPIEVSKVRCPRRVVDGETATFTCSVTVAEGAATVHVEQQGDRLARREAVLVVATVEAFVQQQYEVQLGVGVTAECSTEVLIAVAPGKALECTAVDIEGTSQTAEVKVEDLDGTITLALT
ncbi:MAG TPA: hypothetical protein VMQ81_13335 [Acidimicrobiia bacterium]|nr:hypothetical protein [Acidimicrobiia bacterium]